MYIYVNGIAYNLKKLHFLLKNYPFMLKFKICLKQYHTFILCWQRGAGFCMPDAILPVRLGKNLYLQIAIEKKQYDVVYLCGGNKHYLLERINATGFGKSLMKYINNDGMVIGVSAGRLIFSNNLENNLSLADTKSDVHCITGERRGKLAYLLKNNIKLTNTCALVKNVYC